MARDFIPSKDQDLEAWALNFDTKITAAPTTYGLVAGDATAFNTLRTDYTSKLALAVNPATRTKVTVANKNDARAALVAKARSLAAIINADPDTTDGMRAELGLTVGDQTQTSQPPPATRPLLAVEQNRALEAQLRIVDESTPASRAKPFGVHAAEVYAKVGGEAPGSVKECSFMGLATRNRTRINFETEQRGQTAYVIARWVNAKGEPGPLSSVLSMTIAA